MRRRALLSALPALAVATATPAQQAPLTRRIPSSGETIPAIGLGTWITFNVGQDPPARAQCVQVMQRLLRRRRPRDRLLADVRLVAGRDRRRPAARSGRRRACSPPTRSGPSGDGAAQIEASRAHWQVPRFDLLQVHNLVAWEKQLAAAAVDEGAGPGCATSASPPRRAAGTTRSSR